ncbi:polysaccharide deacetylase family protein [Galbibacter mesophilus]|uniref:polysaccharide deacetylase family protein n=1 Tax=Galbibacter mesophilus TaxID=379069 RepID=UPI00191F34E0|nr:polysaccharide deacetylase family protein [Galbibacter mesophilus]MCM5662601.1 polysaccharide deacetylase family protein [Galbibacter mesophilus]
MKYYPIKIPKILKLFYPTWIWDIKTDKKEVFLTFDDGPTPEVTHFVLDELKKYKAKATFFCIGKNVENHPNILKRILAEGHSVGNHTHNHLNGTKHSLPDYLENIEKAEVTFQKYHSAETEKLFRPPYGRMPLKAAKYLQKKGYKIIMWDVLSGDFDLKNTPENCVENVLKNTKRGSIIVFHDSKKSFPILQKALPKTLEELNQQNFSFRKI